MTSQENLANIKRRIDAFLGQSPNGWCTQEKAYSIAEQVYLNECKLCVELGVFAGRSLLPAAFSLDQLDSKGLIYGVDPWSADASTEGTNDPLNDQFWRNMDYGRFYQETVNYIVGHHVMEHVRLLPMYSREAVAFFKDSSIDFLHQDSNHSEEVNMEEHVLWWPKLKADAVLCLDDTSWPTVQKVISLIETKATLLKKADNWRIYRKTK